MKEMSIDAKRKYVGRINRLTSKDGPGASYLQIVRRKRFQQEIADYERTLKHPADKEAAMWKTFYAQ